MTDLVDPITIASAEIELIAGYAGLAKDVWPSLHSAVQSAANAYVAALNGWNYRRHADWRSYEKAEKLFRRWLAQWGELPDELRDDLRWHANVTTGKIEQDLAALAEAARQAKWLAKPAVGNTGDNREVPGGPPIPPLYEIRNVLHAWWDDHMPTTWAPTIQLLEDRKNPPAEPTNAEAKLLLRVAQLINPHYVAENCHSVVDTRAGRSKG
jgi:hypothetical protein